MRIMCRPSRITVAYGGKPPLRQLDSPCDKKVSSLLSATVVFLNASPRSNARNLAATQRPRRPPILLTQSRPLSSRACSLLPRPNEHSEELHWAQDAEQQYLAAFTLAGWTEQSLLSRDKGRWVAARSVGTDSVNLRHEGPSGWRRAVGGALGAGTDHVTKATNCRIRRFTRSRRNCISSAGSTAGTTRSS